MTPTRRLIMLRHGQTTYNAGGRMQGQLDTPLSENGVEQARAAAAWVKDHEHPVVKIVSSDLIRARDTAEIIAEQLGIDVELDPRLRETHLGSWQGMTHHDVDAEFAGARASWRHNPGWAPPGGESRLDVAARARPLIDDLMNTFQDWDGNTVLFVAHGGTISALTSNLLGLDVPQYPLLKGLNNTNTSQLMARPRFEGAETADGFVSPVNPDDVQWYLEAWNQGLAR
ncbi:histidine phosphatase family protein [Corynebacterium genitalium ATCC 33030]|uniref:Phosphoglycerate mutase family protein n=1 Tax=Corynebacterium genitalium ATCC 33030 TaxID=585529 RepID=D7WC87_9CORY|nr:MULTISPECIES: histidine phosphatase family protein [Corynebacterium]MCQ4618417.1 histidine phosphatase family protein [Corynebacterium pseudogenitalium]EFK54716.1 phosphoglycerate mutase family protein [Corynebacterium genitalium ATCC 33030]MCQ4625461.1 histidine phosphatase family protein [Corynebacterium sp. CCUG 69979]MCQ4627792.1 histidine phosphatase family protein [Corynebacterium sp. CCUG 65737]UUA88965.1 histidine phosphatase family protein [Corynebacterium genitalium ATCC 33030]